MRSAAVRTAVVVAVASCLVIGPRATTGVAAQEPSPQPGAEAAKRLPDVKAFGRGWSMLPPVGIKVSTDVFREGAVGYYGGPEGSRVVVVSLLATGSRVAVRKSWEEAGNIFDQFRARIGYDYAKEEELASLPPPGGCVEAKRSEGTDEQYGFPTGMTLCAADPDIIVLAVASGTVLAKTGHEASDEVAMLAMGGTAAVVTPPVAP